MTGQKVPIGKGFKIRDGKLVKIAYFASASAAIKAKKSKKQTVKRRVV